MNRRNMIKTSVATGLVVMLGLPAYAAKTHKVAIRGFKFVPASLEVNVGDKIEFTNNDSAGHTATAIDASWDTGSIDRGQSKSIAVTAGMGESYKCAFHPSMKGKLVIKA